MKNKYFTERERYQLEILLKEGKSKQEIANILGKCRATIYNEIKRGTVKQLRTDLTEYNLYCADVSHNKYLENRKNKGRYYKIDSDTDSELISFVARKIKYEKWSPHAVIGYINSHNLNYTYICKTTLYSYIKNKLFFGLSVFDLPYSKKAKKKDSRNCRVALKNIRGRSIEERPKHILKRLEYGHWEMDTVYSGRNKGSSCLLVFTERMTRQELIYKISNRTSKSVVACLDKMEQSFGAKRFRSVFKSITCDNGVEFLDFKSMEQSCINKVVPRTTVYYCHPFCSGERGSNENQNKMIRRHIEKGSDISEFSDDDILYIQDWINNYPREIFGFKSSNEYREYLSL